MLLLIVRHAIAVDAAEWASRGRSEADRPLTPEGKRKMKQGAKRLRSLVPELDVLATSPLARANETAQILSDTYGGPPPVLVPALAPGQPPEAVVAWLATQTRHQVVAMVGHEPDLGRAASWAIAGVERSVLELKKGGMCLLDFPGSIGRGTATLRWLLTSAQLRNLKE